MAEKSSIEIRRHRRTMTDKQMDEVAVTVAALIVNFVKSGGAESIQKKCKCEVTDE